MATLVLEPGRGLPGEVWETKRSAWLGDALAAGTFLRNGEAEAAGIRVRREKRDRLLAAGVEAYPVGVPRTHTIAQVRAELLRPRAELRRGDLVEDDARSRARGRVAAEGSAAATLPADAA